MLCIDNEAQPELEKLLLQIPGQQPALLVEVVSRNHHRSLNVRWVSQTPADHVSWQTGSLNLVAAADQIEDLRGARIRCAVQEGQAGLLIEPRQAGCSCESGQCH